MAFAGNRLDKYLFKHARVKGVNKNAHNNDKIAFEKIVKTIHLFPSAQLCIDATYKYPIKCIGYNLYM